MNRIQTTNHPKYFNSMKRLITLLLGIAACFPIAAQQAVTLNLEVEDAPCNGESFCVDVSVEDWTDIILLQTFLEWDPTVLRLDDVQGFDLVELGVEDFDLTERDSGRLFLNWDDIPCGSSGITLPDDQVIFQMCFTAIGSYGDTTQLLIPDNVMVDGVFYPRAFKNSTCANELNVFVNSVGGVISTCVRPVSIIGSQETAFENELVCVDFTVSGFDDLTTMQYTLNWDPGQLQFESVIPNDEIRNLGPESFGLPVEPNIGPGRMTVSWSFTNFSGGGITLDDGTEFFQVCYRVVGECETDAPITFSGDPTRIEVTNTVVEGANIVLVPQEGMVEIGACDPTGLTLTANCPAPANINDEVCVPVSTDNFNGITSLQHLIEWNANILDFKEIRNINGDILGWDAGIFDQTNTANGILGIDFESPAPGNFGSTLSPNGVGTLFEVCFDVTGLGGDSPFNFKGSPVMRATDRDNGSSNIGVNPSSCVVEVIQPEGLTMIIEGGGARPGEQTCLDVTVGNFNDLIALDFSISWESNVANFVEIRNLDPGLSTASINPFGVSGVSFEWTGGPLTIPDNQVLFELCLEMDGEPEACDPELGLVGFPIAPRAETSESNGEDITINSQSAEICVLFPEGFFMDIPSVEGDIRDTVCVPFKVASFDNITLAQFSVTWDASSLFFTGVQNLADLNNFDVTSFNTNATFVGLLDLDWADLSGAALADSTVLFEACFQLLGPPDDCYEIDVSQEPAATISTTNGNGDIVVNPGEICVNNKLFVDAVITGVSCPGSTDGTIELVPTGGRGPLAHNWELLPPQFGPIARNLSEGRVVVTTFDSSVPALIRIDTFEVGIEGAGVLPIADAGVDQELACEGAVQFVVLNGSGSTGPEFSYRWFVDEGGNIEGATNSPTAVAVSQGSYILQVTNNTTGCFTRDTTVVTGTDLPTADAGGDQSFTCETSTLRLNGSLSSAGPNFSYQWAATNGGQIVTGQETELSPQIEAPGTYVLEVTNSEDGCVSVDSVVVVDLQDSPPFADAGEDLTLGCEGSSVILNPATAGGAVAFEWQTIQGVFITSEAQLTIQEPGEFRLKVTDEITGCTAFDTVAVDRMTQESLGLQASAVDEITCIRDTVSISAAVADADVFAVEWKALDGGVFFENFQDSLNTMVRSAGNYRLVVRNLENNCQDSIEVQVLENTFLPIADAGEAPLLTCEQNAIQLDATTGSSTGESISYQWSRGDTLTISETATADIEIPGIYFLEVTDNINGCTERDSVMVDISGEQPQIVIANFEPDLTCLIENTTIDATVQGSTDFEFEWFALGDTGNIVSGAETLSLLVDQPGTYQLRVRDLITGCIGINEAVVGGTKIPPFAEAGDPVDFTCSDETVTVNGFGSASGLDISYQWTSLEGGEVVSTDTTTAEVTGPGLYQIAVSDAFTGCIGFDTVRVEADTTVPIIDFIVSGPIGCGDSTVLIDASDSQPGNDFFVDWDPPVDAPEAIENFAVNFNPLVVEVNSPGQYMMTVVNNESLCESQVMIDVVEADGAPEIVFGDSPSISCIDSEALLDATMTPANFELNTEWVSLDPSNSVTPDPDNPLLAKADGPGMYSLIITVGSGCESRDSIEVLPTSDQPVVQLTDTNLNLECGETVTLDATGSSEGPNFDISWMETSGIPVNDPESLVITVDQAGIYQLMITNTDNDCVDSATVNVVLNTDGLTLATAGDDMSSCEPAATLIGNLPDGTAGEWRALNSGFLETPDQMATAVIDLEAGQNAFIWSLSLPGCINYSTDTVFVFMEATPFAVDDSYTINANQANFNVDFSANDVLTGVSDWTIDISSSPSLGDLSGVVPEGAVYNVKDITTIGTDNFSYTICNAVCPDLCDQGNVEIRINEVSINLDSLDVPNGITPNGDGMNDELVFDILDQFPTQYQDNQMTIFNRWGDIVFEARPYLNNWRGTNELGQELPSGTYYYILRLDIPNGVIIRGDITIVK